MKTFSIKLITIALLFSIANVAIADRGIGRKNKNKTTLNIATPIGLRNSIPFNLKSGLSYKGSLLTESKNTGGSVISNSLLTYQKGNVTYIIPYKHRLAVPDAQQGYTGIKLIIRSH